MQLQRVSVVRHQFAHFRRAPFVDGLGTCRGIRNISACERNIEKDEQTLEMAAKLQRAF